MCQPAAVHQLIPEPLTRRVPLDRKLRDIHPLTKGKAKQGDMEVMHRVSVLVCVQLATFFNAHQERAALLETKVVQTPNSS